MADQPIAEDAADSMVTKVFRLPMMKDMKKQAKEMMTPEITPEMVQAGAIAIEDYGHVSDPYELARRVYIAMAERAFQSPVAKVRKTPKAASSRLRRQAK